MLEIGSLVDGKYRILDEVGRGGMSVVYLARNIRTNKQWAIKEVRRDGTNDFQMVRSNLIAETDILKKLDHPNLPNIIDILDDGDSFIIIMDFIEGNSLQYYLNHTGAQSEEDVVEWSIQLCDVLGYLHSRPRPIIYRDMKPANVMLKPDGNVSLIDFGTAREYKETSVEDTTCLGTQGYAAPEQYGGHGQTDARTDIYNLGTTMYHLVTGHNPAEPPYEMYPIRQWNPALSQGLEEIILRCTQKNPDDRYQSCEELMYALQHRDQLDEQVIRSQKRKLGGFIASAALALAFTVGFFVFGAAQKNALAKSYDNRIKSGESEIDAGNLDKAMEDYSWAVQHAPENPVAYTSLLQHLRDDDKDFSADDGSRMRNLLQGSSEDNRRNEDKFAAADPAEYAKFCYNFGIAYMLGMKTNPSYLNAEQYLQKALESNELGAAEQSLGETLYDMCVLHRMQDYDPMTDDMEGFKGYGVYWEEMYELHKRDQFSNSERMTVEFYRFMVAEITKCTKYFLQDGVEPAEMRDVVNTAEAKLIPIDPDIDIDFAGARSIIDTFAGR